MNKWIERAAIITGTLGFIGVLIVLFITINDHLTANDKKQTTTKKSTVSIESTPTTDAPIQSIDTSARISSDASRPDNVAEITTEQAKEIATKSVTPNDTTKQKTRLKKHRVVTQKTLKPSQLSNLYNAIVAHRSTRNNLLNCVKILSLKASNNKIATTQIAWYFKSKGITITGREMISKSRKGIYINSAGNCISITIGSL